MFSFFDIPLHQDINWLVHETLSRISRQTNHANVTAAQKASFLWNMSRPINAFPPEILDCILKGVPSDGDTDTRSIIPLTHVCKYWRELIISTAANWTKITNKNKRLTALSLSRSNKAPLRISFNQQEDQNHPWFSSQIKPHIEKITSLKIDLTSFRNLAVTFPLFPQSMPNICSLEISTNYTPLPDDPFEFLPFPPTLKCLSLFWIPLFQSFLRVNTLTKFTLKEDDFTLPLDTLLTFLDDNDSLKHVDLNLTFVETPSSNRQAPIQNQLQSLSLESRRMEHLKALICYIPLKSGDLKITSNDQDKPGLKDILPSIKRMYPAHLSSPTHLFWYKGEHIIFSGPNRSFQFNGPSDFDREFTSLPLLLKCIQEAHFKLIYPTLPDFFLFPSLETLVIDYWIYLIQLDALITLLPSPKASPLLKTLAFRFPEYPKEFMEQLTQFALNRSEIPSMRLHRVIFLSNKKNALPSPGLVNKLKKYVSVVELKVGVPAGMDVSTNLLLR